METKNQQNNFSNPIVIVLILALIGLGGYILFSKNSTDNQSQNNQTLDTTSTQLPQKEAQVSSNSSQSCDTIAKKYFATWDTNWNSNFETVNLSYQNHYDQSNGSCYVLVSYNFNMKDNSDGSASLKVTYSLTDVSRKDPYGNYTTLGSYSQSISPVDKYNNRLDTCNVAGADCYTLKSFMSLVNPYLGK
jgi:hypothetical protein